MKVFPHAYYKFPGKYFPGGCWRKRCLILRMNLDPFIDYLAKLAIDFCLVGSVDTPEKEARTGAYITLIFL